MELPNYATQQKGIDSLLKMEIDQERNERKRRLLYDLTDKLKTRGYGITRTIQGNRVDFPQPDYLGEYNSMGILVPKHLVILGIHLHFVRGRMAYLGTLWIDNKIRRVEPDKLWVLDVYGRENVNPLQKLFEQLAQPYGVDIKSGVSTDELRFEGQELYWPGLAE